jgi:hypothetical protein
VILAEAWCDLRASVFKVYKKFEAGASIFVVLWFMKSLLPTFPLPVDFSATQQSLVDIQGQGLGDLRILMRDAGLNSMHTHGSTCYLASWKGHLR